MSSDDTKRASQDPAEKTSPPTAKAEDTKKQKANTHLTPAGTLSKWTKLVKQARSKYEKGAKWDSSALQGDIDSLRTLQKEASQVISTQKNATLSEEESLELEKIKKINRRTVRLITSLQQKYTEEESQIATRLQDEKGLMEQKLKTRTGIEEVVLHLYQQVELIKHQLFQETKRRAELEILLEVELAELNKSLLMESHARSKIQLQIEHALQVKSSIIGELELLKDNMELLVDQLDRDWKAKADDGLNQQQIPARETEIAKLIDMTKSIDLKLSSLNELCEFSNIDVLSTPNAHLQLISDLTAKVAQEVAARKAIELKHEMLEEKISQLQRQLEEAEKSRNELRNKLKESVQ